MIQFKNINIMKLVVWILATVSILFSDTNNAFAQTVQEKFIESIAQDAKKLADENDLYASIMIAQAGLESNWGQSTLGMAPNYNLFGIKGEYNGAYVEKLTYEDDGSGNLYQITDKFRKYPSHRESLLDYVDKLVNGIPGSKLFYSGSWKRNTTSYKDVADFLTGRYATDTTYAGKLIRIIEQYQLTQYDTPSKIKNNNTGVKLTTFPLRSTIYYTVDGKLNSSVQGIKEIAGKRYVIQNGKVVSGESDIFENEWGIYLITKNTLSNQTTLAQYNGEWHYFKEGMFDKTYTGLYQYNGTWYYLKNGKIDISFTGLAQNSANQSWYYVSKGIVDRSFSGLAQNPANQGWYYVNKGELDWSFSGLAQNPANQGWYYVNKGKLDWSFSGLAQNPANQGWYYVNKGKLDWSFSGLAQNPANQGWYYVEKGVSSVPFVFLDPGHGGRDSGAYSYGVKESDVALNVSKKLTALLEKDGYTVAASRDTDVYVDFRTERSEMVNQTNADIFISIHFNSSGSGGAQGIETYWYKPTPNIQPRINQAYHNDETRLKQSELLAKNIQRALIQKTGAKDRGVKRDNFAVLRETNKPAVLVELGFLDNKEENEKIQTEAYLQLLAQALYEGILNYYQAINEQ